MKTGNELSSLAKTIQQFTSNNRASIAIKRFPTGMKHLDAALGGGLSAGLYILGAIPNLGKSTFVLQIAQNLSASGVPVFFFSMEMPKNRIASKAISRQLYLESGNAKFSSDMLLNERETQNPFLWEQIEKVREKVSADCQNLYIIERSNTICSAEDIEKIVLAQMKLLPANQKPVVIVDYLQILSGDSNSRFVSDKSIVDANIRVFTRLAAEQHLPVLVVSAFNRSNYRYEVSMESFKESGSIEYSADVILGMQLSAIRKKEFDINKEKAKTPRDIDIVILKQQYGSSGDTIPLQYFPANDYFKEVGETNDFLTIYSHLPERIFD